RGDFRGAVLGAVNYGRDADSIAVMAGAVCAGLGGAAAVPDEWLDATEEPSPMDIPEAGRPLPSAAADTLRADRERATARRRGLAGLGSATVDEAAVDGASTDGAARAARAGDPA